MNLRPYQIECINQILSRREAGVRSQLVSKATGLGKTVTFANLPEHMPKGAQMVVVAHREELIEQAADKIGKWNPHLSVGTHMASLKKFADGREDVIVSSIQTLGSKRGLDMINRERLHWLVVDEAHHAAADSYISVVNHLTANPDTTLVGFTATPNRADGVGLGAVFSEVVYHYGMLEAISDGWLVDLHGFAVDTGVDIREGFKSKDKMAKAVNTFHRNEGIVRNWIKYVWPRQTIIFTEDIRHAKDMTDAFRRQNINAAAVWGGDEDRRKKLEAFRRGEITVLTNAQLLIEGFDMWQVECVIPAFPTKSQGRVVQEVGRGTRLQEGIDNLNVWRANGWLKDTDKQDCLVMDPLDNFGKHSLVTLPSLFGLPPKLNLEGASAAKASRAIQQAQTAHPMVDFTGLEKLSDLPSFIRRADLFTVRFAEETKDLSAMAWRKVHDGMYMVNVSKGRGTFTIKGDLVGKYTVEGSLLSKNYRSAGISMADAVQLVEKTILEVVPDELRVLDREAKWRKGKVTSGQMDILRKLKVSPEEIVKMNAGMASAYIDKRIVNKTKRKRDEWGV